MMITTRLGTLATILLFATHGGASAANAVTAFPGDGSAEPRSRLTFQVNDCNGCLVQLTNARRSDNKTVVWQSQDRLVRDGKVSFSVATDRTRGMSVSVKAPWEGNTGYRTLVAWRYNGNSVGDTVRIEQAVDKGRAAPCWAGTRERRVTIPLVVESVEVQGPRGPVPGSIAFARETQKWLGGTRRVDEGVLGSQEAVVCR